MLQPRHLPSKKRASQRRSPLVTNQGFTLVELLVVVVITGVLSSIAIPTFLNQVNRAKVAAVASELKSFGDGVLSYAVLNGGYPPDNHNAPPPGTTGYLNTGAFQNNRPFGGQYNWEGPDSYDYAGISIFQPTAPASFIQQLDEILDDGDLSRGRFRTESNGRATYILEECPAGTTNYLCN